MLSAFQARKARMQPAEDAPDGSSKLALPSPPVSAPKQADKHKPKNRPSSKRKPPDFSNDGMTKAKRKKKSWNSEKSPGYFEAQSSLPQETEITADQEDDIAMSDLEDTLGTGPLRRLKTGVQRPWSPSRPLYDSSEDELEDHSGIHNSAPPVTDETPVFSSFVPKENVNFFRLSEDEVPKRCSGGATVLLVPALESIALVGVYSLTVLRGSVSICGTLLGPSAKPHSIFAPRSSPIPIIESLNVNEVESDQLVDIVPARLRSSLTQNLTVLLLEELRTGIQGLGRIVRTFEHAFLPSSQRMTQNNENLGLNGVFACSDQDLETRPFILPHSWDASITSLSDKGKPGDQLNSVSPVVCFVKGAKNTGKSTFARTLLNRLVSRYRKVAFLDCDLGQSEFAPSGLVTLSIVSEPIFGPPFTHPTLPIASHFIGSTSPRNSPSHYLAAIRALVQTYQLDIQYASSDILDGDRRIVDVTPLVVNTMGWTKGLGADLNSKIEELVEATAVFELGLQPAEAYQWKDLPTSGGEWNVNTRMSYPLSAIPPSAMTSRYTPTDHRAIMTLSYFHTATLGLMADNATLHWETTLPICVQPPYEVDVKIAFDQLFLIMGGAEDVVASEIQHVLNGAIVAFLECQDRPYLGEAPEGKLPYIQGSLPPSPYTSNCVGLGFIRALSPTKMHIITPVPPHRLAQCRAVVKGEVELPIWGMLDFRSEAGDTVAGVERSKVPYLKWGRGEGLGAERRRVRRNLMRRSQV